MELKKGPEGRDRGEKRHGRRGGKKVTEKSQREYMEEKRQTIEQKRRNGEKTERERKRHTMGEKTERKRSDDR